MNATARYSQVLLASWRQRDRSSPWLRRSVHAVLILLCVAALVWMPPEAGWRVVGGVALLVVLGAWLAACGSLMEQNHPTLARTVPGHLRSLQGAALLGWALSTALTTLLLWAMLPLPGLWPVLLLSSGFIAVFLLWSSRMVWLWLLLTLLSPLSGVWAARLAPLGRNIAALWEAHTQGLLLLGLLVQAGLVVAALGAGGARHRERYTRQAVMRNAMRMQFDARQADAAAWGRPVEWLSRPFGLAFQAWQRRLLARADNNNPGDVMARAAIVLHGPQHWLYQLMTITAILIAAALILGTVFATTAVDLSMVLRNGALGMGIGIASMGFNAGFTLPNMLWQSRREQALLRLLPGMPQGRALNRAVARLHLRDALAFGLATSMALLAMQAAGANPLLMVLPPAALPIMAVTLTRRPAALRAPTATTAVAPVFLYFMLAGSTFLLVRDLGVPLWLTSAGMAAWAALMLAWRWHRLAAAPMALPAGRLAG